MIYIVLVCTIAVIIFNGFNIYNLYKKLNSFINILQSNGLVGYQSELLPGADAPRFNLKDQFGNIITNNNLEDRKIMFISPTCSTCKMIIRNIEKISNEHLSKLVVISQGEVEQMVVDELTKKKVSYINSLEVVDDFNVRTVPKLIELNEQNQILRITGLSTIGDLNKTLESA